jgi:hypothetical protein
MRRFTAWYVTGPLGHLVAGIMDVGEMFARWQCSRARERMSWR